MVFSSITFVYAFFPLVAVAYYLSKNRVYRNVVLLLASLLFYSWGEPRFLLLMLAATLAAYCGGLLMERCTAHRKLILIVTVVLLVGNLFVFKYLNFFSENLSALFGWRALPKLTLPIGISFYTFQILSYVIDLYRGEIRVQRNYFYLLLYVSFFPQLIAGPIVRYETVEQEILERRESIDDVAAGLRRFILGLAKKVIIANNLWSIVNTFFGKDITGLSVLGTWYTIIVYSLYVYFDFSGYSDIAIGLGRMFGFHFDENFRHPFACTTIAEFWQRWHISLGSFFRDYLLYVPFFGKPRKYFGLFLVWFCTGLWHGAAWNFILWGLYYGCFMLFEQKMGKKRMKKWPIVWKHVYTKLVIILGFGIFYFEDLGQLGQFFLNITGISMLATSAPYTDPMTFSSLRNNIFLILFAILVSLPVLPKIKSYFLESKNDTVYTIGRVGAVAVCMVLLAIVSVLLVDTTNNVFLYFRF